MGNELIQDGIASPVGANKMDPKVYKRSSGIPSRRQKANSYLHVSKQKTAPSRRRMQSTSSTHHSKYKRKKQHRDVSSKRPSKRRQRPRKSSNGSITSTVSENAMVHSNNVVEQLVSLGYGTEKEVIAASALSRNHRDINEVLKKLTMIQSNKPITFNSKKKHSLQSSQKKHSLKSSQKKHAKPRISAGSNQRKISTEKPKQQTTKSANKYNYKKTQMNDSENILKIIDWINSTSPAKPTNVNKTEQKSAEKTEQKSPNLQPKQSPKQTSVNAKHLRSKSLSDREDIEHDHILCMPTRESSFEDEDGEGADNFAFTLDLKESKAGMGKGKDVPKFDPLPHSHPQSYKYRKKMRLELRNSISATSMTTNLRKIEALKNEIRESIESTLSEVSAVIEDETKDNKSVKVNVSNGGAMLRKVRDPPLLSVSEGHLLYWNDSNKGNEYIVCCTGHHMFNSEYKPGVYLYNLNTFEVKYLSAYPDKVFANGMGMSIDYENMKLHLFGGKGLLGQWLILNLKAKIWDIRKNLDKFKIPFGLKLENIKCVIIENSLFIYSLCGKFLRYNRRKHKFAAMDTYEGNTLKNIKCMFYVSKQKRIYVMHIGSIYYCESTSKDSALFREYKWHKMNSIKLPNMERIKEGKFNAVLGFEHILFVFYYESKQVGCVDLLKEKVYLCNKTINIINLEKSKLVNTESNILHSICMDHNGPIHNIIKLNDILVHTNMI